MEKALTKPVTERKKPVDHEGHKFKTRKEMCDYWNVSLGTYQDRIKHGYTLEEALTGITKTNSNAIRSIDHEGNEFPTMKAMCKYWNISINAYKSRLEAGMSVKDALTSDRFTVKDHLGNSYDSIDSMCQAYNITPAAYYQRLKKNWSLEKTLMTKLRYTKKRTQETTSDKTDHLGNTYPDMQSMCDTYGIEMLTYKRRLERGWDKKTALTEPIDTTKHGMEVTDPYGKTFPMLKDMLLQYHIKTSAWFERKQKGYTDAEALGIIPLIGPQIKNEKVNNNLLILRPIIDDETNILYFHCFSHREETVYSRSELLTAYKASLNLISL